MSPEEQPKSENLTFLEKVVAQLHDLAKLASDYRALCETLVRQRDEAHRALELANATNGRLLTLVEEQQREIEKLRKRLGVKLN